MKVVVVLVCCFCIYNETCFAQKSQVFDAKDSTQRLFSYHFKILDSAAKGSRVDTIGGFIQSVSFMEKHTRIESGTEGSFLGRLGFTKTALNQWHEWYDKRYKKKMKKIE